MARVSELVKRKCPVNTWIYSFQTNIGLFGNSELDTSSLVALYCFDYIRLKSNNNYVYFFQNSSSFIMASTASMALMSYSDCCRGFQQCRGVFAVKCRSSVALSLPSMPFHSLSQQNRSGFLRVTPRPLVVCALQPKSKY